MRLISDLLLLLSLSQLLGGGLARPTCAGLVEIATVKAPHFSRKDCSTGGLCYTGSRAIHPVGLQPILKIYGEGGVRYVEASNGAHVLNHPSLDASHIHPSGPLDERRSLPWEQSGYCVVFLPLTDLPVDTATLHRVTKDCLEQITQHTLQQVVDCLRSVADLASSALILLEFTPHSPLRPKRARDACTTPARKSLETCPA